MTLVAAIALCHLRSFFLLESGKPADPSFGCHPVIFLCTRPHVRTEPTSIRSYASYLFLSPILHRSPHLIRTMYARMVPSIGSGFLISPALLHSFSPSVESIPCHDARSFCSLSDSGSLIEYSLFIARPVYLLPPSIAQPLQPALARLFDIYGSFCDDLFWLAFERLFHLLSVVRLGRISFSNVESGVTFLFSRLVLHRC